MELRFERGNADQPSGHALIYFSIGSSDRVLATYVVIGPISFNLAKYVPPMFAAQMAAAGNEGARPVPLPPVPEEVPGKAYLERLAEIRNDDLIFAGMIIDDDAQRLMLETTYAAEAYGKLYHDHSEPLVAIPAPVEELDAAAVLYGVMSEGQRLAELTKLTGTLREATEQKDLRGMHEAATSMRSLLSTLSPKYRGEQLLNAAEQPGDIGRKLCQLLLERAYALHREEYLDVGRLDREIDALGPTA